MVDSKELILSKFLSILSFVNSSRTEYTADITGRRIELDISESLLLLNDIVAHDRIEGVPVEVFHVADLKIEVLLIHGFLILLLDATGLHETFFVWPQLLEDVMQLVDVVITQAWLTVLLNSEVPIVILSRIACSHCSIRNVLNSLILVAAAAVSLDSLALFPYLLL